MSTGAAVALLGAVLDGLDGSVARAGGSVTPGGAFLDAASDRIGEIAVPTRYFEEASSVGFNRSVVYGLSTLRVVARYLLHRLHVRPSPKLTTRR